MKNDKPVKLTELRKLRNNLNIVLEEVGVETGMSVGFLSRIERGIKRDIKSNEKREILEKYIMKLRKRTKVLGG